MLILHPHIERVKKTIFVFFNKYSFLKAILSKTIGGPISLIDDNDFSEQLLYGDFFPKVVLGWTRGHFKA